MARSRREYNFTPDYDSTVKIAESRGMGFDSIFKENAKVYKARDGSNQIRILPPAWEKPKHYGFQAWVHSDVGPNNRQYLCLKENEGSPHRRCPVCDILYDLGGKATQEDRQKYRPKLSYLYYIIDREAMNEGVQIWRTSQKTTSEVALQSIDRRNHSVLDITHPEDGYDVEFTRVGTGRTGTRYHGFMVMRQSTPLADNERRGNEWLDYTEDHPLPSILNFYSPDHIEEVLYGRSRSDDDDEGASDHRRRRSRDEDDEPPRRLRRTRDDEDEDVDDDTRDSRRADDDDDAPRARSSRDDDTPRQRPRARREEPDDEEDQPRASARGNGRDEGRRARTKLAEDLDDDVPFDQDDKQPEPEPRRAARSRPRLDDDEPEKGDTDKHAQMRERMRSRLDRR